MYGSDIDQSTYASGGTVKNIGIITSGGDCGGLNGVIKGAALTALSKGMTAWIVPNGYAGLYNLTDIKSITKLTKERIEHISIFLAGSEAGNSRVKISKIKDDNKHTSYYRLLYMNFNVFVLI